MSKGKSSSEEVLKERTGKSILQWTRILDKFNVKKKGHTQAAKYLLKKHDLTEWWAQAVVMRYEARKRMRKTIKRSRR